MKLRSVNVSGLTQVVHQGELVQTGIFKRPVAGPVTVGTVQIAGDRQADLVNHGGEDKAVYGYPWEHYAHWSGELGRDDFEPGQFGENLTTEGILESELSIGDRLRVGTVLLEVSQPRVPCFKLNLRMKHPGFSKIFLKSGRVGFYFRVLEAGEVEAGDVIKIEATGHERITIMEAVHTRFFDNRNVQAIRRLLSNPALAAVWRHDLEALAARAESSL
ncbi:MAG: MOSC domain-containing protein [Candidatus Hydrogenedentes bacterium]|nr:MOSC domain-containing protein [Candidatus Hydrogenedentota bacterium]